MVNKKGSKKNKHWAKVRFLIERAPQPKMSRRWRLIGCNGRTLCTSDNYGSEGGALKTINSVISAIQKKQFRVEDESNH